MKKKIFIGIVLFIILISLIRVFILNTVSDKNKEIIKEYVPEVEISDNELRKTLVKLYFLDNEGKMVSEERLIDSKELLRNPYMALVGMLIDGPKNENFKKIIPDDTKIIDVKLNKKCVTVNLSKEFVENCKGDVNEKTNMIKSIVNTLTELNEVQSVKFLINGEEIEGFEEPGLKLNNEFARTELQ